MLELDSGWSRQSLLVAPMNELIAAAGQLRDKGHGRRMSYSRKVFVPLTQLCRDVCHYCTFAQAPKRGQAPFMSPDEVLAVARSGERAGCDELLFTLGDKPELRYPVARAALNALGYESTISYLLAMCDLVLRETSLLPHVNPGVMKREEVAALRKVSVSQGIMLESASARLCEKGGVHYGSPDKHPAVRLETIRAAGELQVPFTSGILIGIGETREERVDSLLALYMLHKQYGHLQEIIIQNFRAKIGTKCSERDEPDLHDLMWTIAVARLIFGSEMNIQAPPNLSPTGFTKLIEAGINDWGGVSPVTPDHVNPEAPWPEITALETKTRKAGKDLVQRLAVYPFYAANGERWLDGQLRTRILRRIDADGYPRSDAWSPGLAGVEIPQSMKVLAPTQGQVVSRRVAEILNKARDGVTLLEDEIVVLFRARGEDFKAVCRAADRVRETVSGNVVRYVVNRNINYTNVCKHRCNFCAFSKGRGHADLRGPAYDLAMEEIVRRAREARRRGATEVCMQGGIHPGYTGATYLDIVRAIKMDMPEMHVHAFSPLEITHGARTLGLSVTEFLQQLRQAGLGSLPGTAAEILCDDVRALICPDKLNSAQWVDVIESAHRVGIKTTSTIMFGHVENAGHWATHLLAIRALQERTGGITEFVPLPFVHMEAPLYRNGGARRGPTFRETVLMHAVARLALHPVIPNIQVSWVKLGAEGVRACLASGANDLGGTLMNESISNAAGTEHGQEFAPAMMDALIASTGRLARQRTTLYGSPHIDAIEASYHAAALSPVIMTPAGKRPVNQPGACGSNLFVLQ